MNLFQKQQTTTSGYASIPDAIAAADETALFLGTTITPSPPTTTTRSYCWWKWMIAIVAGMMMLMMAGSGAVWMRPEGSSDPPAVYEKRERVSERDSYESVRKERDIGWVVAARRRPPPPRRASSWPRNEIIRVFLPVVRLVGSVPRPTNNGIPLKRVTNTGRRKNTVGRNRTGTCCGMVFHPVSRIQGVVCGRPWIPNTSTPPASTQTPIPSGADPRVKASIRSDK